MQSTLSPPGLLPETPAFGRRRKSVGQLAKLTFALKWAENRRLDNLSPWNSFDCATTVGVLADSLSDPGAPRYSSCTRLRDRELSARGLPMRVEFSVSCAVTRNTDGSTMNRIVPIAFALSSSPLAAPRSPSKKTAVATFAGGCFWCVEPPFDKVDGVISTTSGYIGGQIDNPTYKQVSAGGTGHAEAVEIVYDPAKVSYEKLLDIFWRNIDPLAKDRQFCDDGDSTAARSSFTTTSSGVSPKSRRREIEVREFEPADPDRDRCRRPSTRPRTTTRTRSQEATKYKFYRWNCGRDQRLEELWGTKRSRRMTCPPDVRSCAALTGVVAAMAGWRWIQR